MLSAETQMQMEAFLHSWQRRGDITGCARNIKLRFTFSRQKKRRFCLAGSRGDELRNAAPERRLSRTFSQEEAGDGVCSRSWGGGVRAKDSFCFCSFVAQRWSSFFRFACFTHRNRICKVSACCTPEVSLHPCRTFEAINNNRPTEKCMFSHEHVH